jgi:hypothetical protein
MLPSLPYLSEPAKTPRGLCNNSENSIARAKRKCYFVVGMTASMLILDFTMQKFDIDGEGRMACGALRAAPNWHSS